MLRQKPPYVLLLDGRFSPAEVAVSWDAEPCRAAAELQEAINRAWERLDPNPHFNGRIARLDGWQVRGRVLRLQLRPTDYKTLLYSNNHADEIVGRWGEKQLANALGISAVVISADEQVILMQRSQRVGEFPGAYDVFGGHIDVPASGDPPDLFASMAQELEEELALSVNACELSCFGLLQALLPRKPELLFIAKCRLESEALMLAAKGARDCYEYSRLLKIAARPTEIASFLRLDGERTSPSAFGALEMFAATLSIH
jgi:hypothetical protein